MVVSVMQSPPSQSSPQGWLWLDRLDARIGLGGHLGGQASLTGNLRAIGPANSALTDARAYSRRRRQLRHENKCGSGSGRKSNLEHGSLPLVIAFVRRASERHHIDAGT